MTTTAKWHDFKYPLTNRWHASSSAENWHFLIFIQWIRYHRVEPESLHWLCPTIAHLVTKLWTYKLLIVHSFSSFKHTPWKYTTNKYGNIYVSRANTLTQHTLNNAFKIKIEIHVKLTFILGTKNLKENEKNRNYWRSVHILVIKWVRIHTLIKSHESVFFFHWVLLQMTAQVFFIV